MPETTVRRKYLVKENGTDVDSHANAELYRLMQRMYPGNNYFSLQEVEKHVINCGRNIRNGNGAEVTRLEKRRGDIFMAIDYYYGGSMVVIALEFSNEEIASIFCPMGRDITNDEKYKDLK